MIYKPGDLPACCTGSREVPMPRVTGCTDEENRKLKLVKMRLICLQHAEIFDVDLSKNK